MRNHSGKARPAKRWQTCTSRSHLWPVPCLQESPTVPGTLGAVETAPSCPFLPIEGAERFVPYRDIESIELLDDPEYERIDDIHDVCTGDIFVETNGNRFFVVAVDDDDETDCTLAVMVQAEIPNFHYWMLNSNFAYALRRKPKLPNHDGLWLDKDDAIWQVCDHQAVPVYDDADEWGLQREIFLVSQLVQHAPFRPAKAVEA